MQRIILIIAAAGIMYTAGGTDAQSPADQSARFEVASVKRHPPDDRGSRFLRPEPGGRLTVVDLPVSTLVWMAYRVQAYQVLNAPPWATTEGYDILAKAPDGVATTMDTFRPMLRELLADRFQLKVRMETRELPVYNLVRARSDGQLGKRLKPSQGDCGTPTAARSGGAPVSQVGTACGAFGRMGGFTMGGLPIGTFTSLLSTAADRIVVDKTGLTGNWDLELDFTRDQMPAASPGALPVPAPPPSSDAPSLFTALQEQLGLKLEPGRAPVEVVVIESVSRPTEN